MKVAAAFALDISALRIDDSIQQRVVLQQVEAGEAVRTVSSSHEFKHNDNVSLPHASGKVGLDIERNKANGLNDEEVWKHKP